MTDLDLDLMLSQLRELREIAAAQLDDLDVGIAALVKWEQSRNRRNRKTGADADDRMIKLFKTYLSRQPKTRPKREIHLVRAAR